MDYETVASKTFWYDGDKKVYIYEIKKNTREKLVETNKSQFSYSPKGLPTMELTGEIIVYFKENIPKEKIENWCKDKSIEIKENLNIPMQNAWLLKTKIGQNSLQLANKFKNDPLVVKSFPNWHYLFKNK